MKLMKNKFFWICSGLILLHVVLVLRMFPPSVPASGDLLFKGDFSRYFASMASVKGAGGIHGYDPHFMAGYPAGLWNSMGKKAYELAALALPGVPLPLVLYGITVFFAAAAPLLLWLSSMPFIKTPGNRTISLLLILALWHLDSHISGFWNFGNVCFPAAACLALSGYGFAYRAACGKKWVFNAVLFGVVSAIAVYCHPSMALTCIAVGAAAFLVGKGRSFARWLWLPVSAACAGLILAPWAVPLLKSAQDCMPLQYEGFQGTPKHLVMDVFSDRMFRRHFDRNAFLHLTVIGGLLGLWLNMKKQEKENASGGGWLVGISAVGIVCLIVTYSFSLVPALRPTQPYRFIVPGMLALLPATLLAIGHVIRVFREADNGVRAALLALLLIAMPAFSAYFLDELEKEPATGIPVHYSEAFRRINGMDVEGRILLDDVALGHLLPYHTDASVIGGLSAEAFTKHGFAGVDYKEKVFGRGLDDWVIGDLADYLRTYGVEYVLLSSSGWQRYAASRPDIFELLDTLQAGRLYAFSGYDGLAADNAGRVKADYNMINVSEAASSEITLRYHYSPSLSASDGVVIEPEAVLGSPVPFIKCLLPEGVSSFSVRFGD